MNWKITLDETLPLVRVSTQGDFTIEDCMAIKKDFTSQSYWKPGMNVLIDYREVIFSGLTLDDLRELGKFHESQNEEIGNGRMVLLMKSPRDFGYARQYEMLNESRVSSKMRVFLEEDKAIEWLSSETAAY